MCFIPCGLFILCFITVSRQQNTKPDTFSTNFLASLCSLCLKTGTVFRKSVRKVCGKVEKNLVGYYNGSEWDSL